MPPAAKGILKTFWEEGLQFDYKDVFDKPKTPQESLDRDHAWSSNRATVRQELQKIEIAAPDGARTISDEEADRIVALVRKVSGNIIVSVK